MLELGKIEKKRQTVKFGLLSFYLNVGFILAVPSVRIPLIAAFFSHFTHNDRTTM